MTDYFSKISYLMIEANSQCNLKCIHCTREQLAASGLREPESLTEQKLIHLLEQLKDCPIDTIKFEGLSEPMIFPDFGKRTKILRSYFPRAHVIVITNLQYKISKTPLLETLPFIDALYISVDGVGAVYEKIRSGAHFDRFLANLNEMTELVSKETRAQKIHLNFTATNQNYFQLKEIYALKEKFGLSSVRINLVQNWDEASGNHHTFPPPMLEELRKYQSDVRGVPDWNYSDCFWPFNGIVIDVSGNIRQCVLNTTQIPIGNAFENPLREIYNNSIKLQEARRRLTQNDPPSSCQNCDYKGLTPVFKEIFTDSRSGQAPRQVKK